MVSVLLTILKILGIVLLCVLGMALLLICLVLFVPVRYRVRLRREQPGTEQELSDKPPPGQKPKGREQQKPAPFEAAVKVTWLLHLISASFSWPENAFLRVRLLGITILRTDRKKKKETPAGEESPLRQDHSSRKKDPSGEKPSEEEKEISGQAAFSEAEPPQKKDQGSGQQSGGSEDRSSAQRQEASAPGESSAKGERMSGSGDDSSAKQQDASVPGASSAEGERMSGSGDDPSAKQQEAAAPGESSVEGEQMSGSGGDPGAKKQDDRRAGQPYVKEKARQGQGFWAKLRAFFGKLLSLLQNIRYTITGICDKIKDIVNNIQYYLKILRSDTFRRAWSVCAGEALSLLRSILPGKLSGRLVVGTGDPAGTGQVLALYGILYPFIGGRIEVTPDFERQILEGELMIKGKITVFRALKTAWRIYFNRDLRRLIKLLKREAA